MAKLCAWCGKPFKHKNPYVRFCSKDCRNDSFVADAWRLRESYGIDPLDDDVTNGRPRQLTTDGKCNHADALPEITVQELYDREDKTRPLPYRADLRFLVCETVRQRCQKCQRLLPTMTFIDTGKIIFKKNDEPPIRVFAVATKPSRERMHHIVHPTFRPQTRCNSHVGDFKTIETACDKRPGWVRSECAKCGAFIGYRPEAR